MHLAVKFELGSLGGADAGRLRQLVSDAGFFDLPAQVLSKERQPDRFSYRLTVTGKERSHTVEVDEEVVPGQLAPLIDWLTRMAASR